MIAPVTEVLADRHWGGGSWRSRLGGASIVSVANGILTTTSSEITQAAFKDLYIPARPGMRVELEVDVRKLSGDATGTGIYIDYVAFDGSGTLVADETEATGNDWKKIAGVYTVPEVLSNDQKFVRLAFGVRTANLGDARWRLPIIRTGRGYGGPLVIARGLLRLQAGVPDLHPSFPSHGIASLAFNGTDTVTMTLEHQVPTVVDIRPLVRVNPDTNVTAIPVGGNLVGGAAPTFLIKWTNGAAFQNISAGNWFAYFSVEY